MKKDKKIQKIIQDLCEFDPELKKHEKQLEKTVAALLELKPENRFDQEFAKKLKKELLARRQKRFSVKIFKNAWFFVPAGATVLFVVLLSSLYWGGFSDQPSGPERGRVALEIEAREKEAFGPISAEIEELDTPGVHGGGQLTQEVNGDTPGLGVTGEQVVPRRVNYDFVYVGDDFSPEEENLSVFKRVKDDSLSRDLINQISSFDFDLLDLDSFQNKELRSFSFSEDREFGYSLEFNLRDNSLHLSKNRDRWPNPMMECQGDPACLEDIRLKPQDIPDNKTILEKSYEFMKEFGINTDYYGEGQVQDSWRQSYELSSNKDNFLVPDSLSVIYPLEIKGKQVFQKGGDSFGLNLEFDVRQGRVSGLNNFFLPQFESSLYPAVKQGEDIISQASKGGLFKPFEHSDPTEIQEIKLGTPNLELVRVYSRGSEGQESGNLYLPSFIFPVVESPEDSYFLREYIVVPAIEGTWGDPHTVRPGLEERY